MIRTPVRDHGLVDIEHQLSGVVEPSVGQYNSKQGQIIAEEPIPSPSQPRVPETPVSDCTHRTRNCVSSWGTVQWD